MIRPMEYEGTAKASDGRTLAFVQRGAPDGVPVIVCHGTPGSRRSRHPDPEMYRRHGVRMVAYDRPGYGASDPNIGRSVADAASDTRGTISPPIPIERMNGSGMRTSSASPSATVIPEKSVAELAALSGVSRFQLLRGFSREVGITPHAYIIQRRVILAQRFLADGQTAAEAATQAGFSDQSHMTRAFVRQVGVTPGCYRAAVA